VRIFRSLALAVALPSVGMAQSSPPPPAASERAARALSAWYECQDCDAGELNAVTRYGERVVPSLIAALNGGASPARREGLRRSLGAAYDQMAEQAQRYPERVLPESRSDYIERYAGNLDAQYRIRAAQALAALGGPQAAGALEAALAKPQRDDVRRAVERSLQKIK
jgi:hypothetical protein